MNTENSKQSIAHLDGIQPVSKYPTKVFENDVCELWYRPDDIFLLPRACCCFYFKASAPFSGEKFALNTLFHSILANQRMNGTSEMQNDVEYFYQIVDDGIVLKAYGLNQNLQSVVNEVTVELKKFAENVTEEELRQAIEGESKEFKFNFEYTDELRKSIIRTGRISSHEKSRRAKSIQLIDLQNFCRELFESMKVLGLIQGDLSCDAAKSIMQMVVANLGSERCETQKTIEYQARKLPLGANYLLVNAYDRRQKRSATVNFYQIGPISMRTKLLLEVFLGMSKQLCTCTGPEKMPNCCITWNCYDDCGILGYAIIGNSAEEENPSHVVEEYIEELRGELVLLVENMPAEEFQKELSLAIDRKNRKDPGLEHETGRNWYEVLDGEFLFDRRQREIEIISTITQSELLQFYREHSGANERKLSIQFIGFTKATAEADAIINPEIQKMPDDIVYAELRTPVSGTVINDIDDFKKKLDVFQ